MGQLFNRIKDIWKSKNLSGDVNSAHRIINDDSDNLKKIIDELNNQNKNKKDSGTNHSNIPNFEVTNAYKVLNINSNSTIEQIKIAYKKLMKEFHPDLVTKENQNIQKEAQRKSQEINFAYNILKKHLNFN